MAAIRAAPARLVATVLAAGAALALVIGTIGPPLVGNGVFLTSDLIYFAFPWEAEADPVSDLHAQLGGPATDTVDVVFPARAVFGEQAREGDFAAWNPYNFGGEPLGATSNYGQLNPLLWPYVLLPAWFAPAMVKLAGMATALAFTYLFCRRIGTDRVPAALGAVVFAGSGFIVMWNNWPQADVASLIPVLFWATERFLQRRTASSAIPIALALACLLLGQFPAVVGYALTVLAGYVFVRLACAARWSEVAAWWRRRRSSSPAPAHAASAPAAAAPEGAAPEPGEAPAVGDAGTAGGEGRLSVRQTLVVGVGALAALLAGVLLVAVVLLPFGARLSSIPLDSREQSPDGNLRAATLVTAAAPSAFGISNRGVNYNGPSPNQIESISYVGVVALALAVAAVALPRVRRAPPGAIVGLAASTAVLGVATYGGGPVLGFLQRFPVYDMNFIGRTRSVLGFTVAALAALGLQALLERARAEGGRPWRPLDLARLVAVAGGAAWLALWAYGEGDAWARSNERAGSFAEAMASSRTIGVIVVAAVVLLIVGRGPGRQVLAAGVVVLATVEGLMFAVPLLPNESRDTLYPETPGLAYLQEHVGSERVVPDGYTLFGNATMLAGVRSVTGHGFHSPAWKEMLAFASPGAFSRSPTLGQPSGEALNVGSPIFDRLGARWFAGSPASEPFGSRQTLTLDRADCTTLADADVVTTYGDMSYGLWGVAKPTTSTAPTPRGADPGGGLTVAPVGPETARPAPVPATGAGPVGLAGIVPEGHVVARMRVPGANGLHGVVVRLCQPVEVPAGSFFNVTAVAGDVTATGMQPVRGEVTPRDLALPVAGGELAGDAPIDVTVTLVTPEDKGVHLAGGPGGGVAADLIRPDDDGLRLAFAGDLRIYERTRALPRIRWSPRSAVIADRPERVRFLGSGAVPDDTVILSEGTAGGSGRRGKVEVIEDDDAIRLSVDADGDGYVVIADGMQTDWVATVDGREADLLDADHSGVAVEVPEGEHTIEVRYEPRGQLAGARLSVATAVGLVVVGSLSLVRQWRRRRAARRDADGPAAEAPEAPDAPGSPDAPDAPEPAEAPDPPSDPQVPTTFAPVTVPAEPPATAGEGPSVLPDGAATDERSPTTAVEPPPLPPPPPPAASTPPSPATEGNGASGANGHRDHPPAGEHPPPPGAPTTPHPAD